MQLLCLEAAREVLAAAGYRVAVRNDGWFELLVLGEADRWVGRGHDEGEAYDDALRQMFPSRLSRALLEKHASRSSAAHAEGGTIRAPAPLAPPPEPAVAREAPLEPVWADRAPVNDAAIVAPAVERLETAEAPASTALPLVATVRPEAPAPPAHIPELRPIVIEIGDRSFRARTTESLDRVEQILQTIETRLGALARMSSERQRLHMMVWICQARAIEEALPEVREVEHATARVARRLTEIGKMFWPGSVRALQLSARPADVRREMHATWAAESKDWHEATILAERLLSDHLAKSADQNLDEDGWADGTARQPPPAEPDVMLAMVENDLRSLLTPPGEVPNARLPELGPTEFEGLLNSARKLRWLRGQVRDDLAWGVAMGRLRRAASAMGDRSPRVREVLDHRTKPSGSWAKAVGERDDAPIVAVGETQATLAAQLPGSAETKEGLLAWLIRAFDVLNTPELVTLLMPYRGVLGSFGEDTLNHSDRRVRRRLRELVRGVATADPSEIARAAAARIPEPPPPESEEQPSDDSLGNPALDTLSARVRAQTTGSRALFVSNRDDPELGAKLEELLGITITWCDGSLRRVQAQCERIARGSYDLVLSATGFQVHGVDSALAKAANAAGVPYVRVNRGRPVACVQAIAREFGLTSGTYPVTPTSKASADSG